MTPSERMGRFGRVAGLAGALAVAACSESPTEIFPPLEIIVASGDQQYGTTGQTLGRPLRVLVRTVAGEVPQVGADVDWDVLEGDASILGVATTATDSTGSAQVGVRLGATTGPVTIEATVRSQNRPSVTFQAFSVDQPEFYSVSPSVVVPGETMTLTGANFSPDADQNVVLFSGIRGRVLSASTTELTVEVPECLPPRSVSVSVQLGVVATGSIPVSVGAGAVIGSPAVGEVLDVADEGGFTCLGLPGDGARYLALVHSTSTVGAARHPFVLSGLTSAAPAAATAATSAAEAAAAPGSPGAGSVDPQGAWDYALRELESVLAEEAGGRPRASAGPAAAPSAAPPLVGDRRTFQVFQATGQFVQVTAVAQLVSQHAALYVDENAPAGGYTQEDLQLFADRFDGFIHPEVTATFGAVSDLDDNQRVVILFTPAVNALTPRGSVGFVGGFFFGIDLLTDREGSNGGEVFYTLVPDPNGLFSDPRAKEDVLQVAPAILAHEFQHMIGFNERVLRLGAESTEAVWLSEGLAQYAEEIVALSYEASGDAASAALFRSGTRGRARRYLARPDTVSLIISTGQGSLPERGAGFLHVMYLQDQLDGDLLGRLTRTTRTGVTNVEAETGRDWEDVLADWWSAIYLDGPGPETGPRVYPDVDLAGLLGDPFPLEPVELGAGDFGRAGSLWSSSAAYYMVTPPAGGWTALRLGGEGGGPSGQEAGLRMRVIRIS